MVSFDVTSLYTMITIIDTLNIIKDYVSNDNQFTRKKAISQDNLLDLVKLLILSFSGILLVLSFTNKLMALQWEDQHSTIVEIYIQAH